MRLQNVKHDPFALGTVIKVKNLGNNKIVDAVIHKVIDDTMQVVINKSITLTLIKKRGTAYWIGNQSGMEFQAVVGEA
jgi:hypothetical protein